MWSKYEEWNITFAVYDNNVDFMDMWDCSYVQVGLKIESSVLSAQSVN